MNLTKTLLEYEPVPENILPLLKKVSAVFGWVSEENCAEIARYFSLPTSRIYETATFYDLIRVKKGPQFMIQVCSSANCAANNSFRLVDEIESALRIKAGDTFNKKVRLEEVSCLGRCGEGPVMVVNGKVYEKVTRSMIYRILEEYL